MSLEQSIADVGEEDDKRKASKFENFNSNNPFLKKLPKGTEAANSRNCDSKMQHRNKVAVACDLHTTRNRCK